jgi:hypothetical protein
MAKKQNAKKLSELTPSSEVVVEFGEITQISTVTGKSVVTRPGRKEVMTLSGANSFEVNEHDYSEAIGRTVKVLGTPKYKEEVNPLQPNAKIKVLDGYDEFEPETETEDAAPAA